MAYLKAAVSRSDLSFTKPGPTFRLFSPRRELHFTEQHATLSRRMPDVGGCSFQFWRLRAGSGANLEAAWSVEQVNERVSSSKGHRSALRSLAALAQSKSAISKSSGLKKKTTKKGTVDAKDMTRLDLPFCEHLQSRKVFEAKLFYRRCRARDQTLKMWGFFN